MPRSSAPDRFRGEYRDRHRHLDIRGLLRGRAEVIVVVLPVETGGRRPGVGQPIEADVIEHFIATEHAFRLAVTVGPGREFLVHPRCRTRGRVGEQVADGLRSGHHHRAVGRVTTEERTQGGVGPAFRIGQPRRCRIAAVDLLYQLGRHGGRHVQVDAQQSGRRQAAQRIGNHRTMIAALRHVMAVAQALHQHVPGLRHPVGAQPNSVGLPEKPWPGIDGMITSKASSARPP